MRDDDWLATHRFTLERAIRAAETVYERMTRGTPDPTDPNYVDPPPPAV